jgi:hypothetical protein
MFNWKKILVLGAVVASLFVTSIPAQAAEFEEADYLKITSYKETMKPTESMDGILSIAVEGEVGEDGYLYVIESVKGMELTGSISGENLGGDLEAVKIGSVNYYRVKAADESAPVVLNAEFTCAKFYAPTPKADTNGGNALPISYKFVNSLESNIGKYSIQIFVPQGYQIVKVTTPSAYADYILDEVDGMRSVGLNGSVKAGATSTVAFNFNPEHSTMQNAIVWVVCLGVGLAVLVDRMKKARK